MENQPPRACRVPPPSPRGSGDSNRSPLFGLLFFELQWKPASEVSNLPGKSGDCHKWFLLAPNLSQVANPHFATGICARFLQTGRPPSCLARTQTNTTCSLLGIQRFLFGTPLPQIPWPTPSSKSVGRPILPCASFSACVHAFVLTPPGLMRI